MFAALTCSITSTLRKTLQFLGMLDNAVETPSFLKPEDEGTDVERYLDDLLNGYNAQGAGLMQKYRVKEVNHCKENTDVGHEYVSVKVEGPDTETPFYIVFERFRGLKDKDPTTVAAQEGGTTPTPAREQTLSSRSLLVTSSGLVQRSSNLALRSTALSKETSSPSLQDGRANDKASTMRLSTKTGTTKELCETITFEKDAPPPLLYQVAVLAVAVHRSQAKYNLNDASCFFYAAAIIELIKKVFPSFIRSVSENSSLKAGYVPGLQRTPFFSVWSANKIEEGAVDEIISSYRANLTQFENNVCFATVVLKSSANWISFPG